MRTCVQMTALAGQSCSDRRATMLRAEPVSQNSPATTRLTYEDYLKTPDDERYELLDGALIVPPAPNTAHQSVQAELGWRMARFIREGGLGHLFFAPTDVVLSRTDVVQPDLLFISSQRAHIIAPANIQGAPDLIVEIRSESTAERDESFKRQLYANFGVKEYWLVDPEAATISILLLGEYGYDEAATYTLGQTLTSPMLDGLLINLDDLFLVRDSTGPTS
ncbi:MAG: Uma2 family endonuclease [Caldilineaceae bacterium SB0675_bin_29]|uniref:Uma2 family endonuclease n=1 Tax=Caldilineaceae bacterium SB0675_bin_29 TaxID=2605266 RepID=A0A6B1G6L6_9CHLR|nr:Uma2 family endonuclease [Caldilineaceae bacterium SB0675_bin_29]